MTTRWSCLPVLCLWLCAEAAVAAVPVSGARPSLEGEEPEEQRTVTIFQQLAPATVFLSVTYPSGHPLTAESTSGVGAGFIVDEEGRTLTNAHVVDGAASITATLFDGRKIKAELLGLDPLTDVAVLRLEPHGRAFVPATMGDSDHLHVGQRALIVGSPFGLGFTLTSGIISGFGPGAVATGTARDRLIQTTAPINPGNSGGPLVDSRGRVVGMTTATLVGAQNIGFAIPINVAKAVLNELRHKGRIERPWLGVTGKFVTDELMTLLAVPLAKGLLVVDIEDGSPALDSPLRKGHLRLTIEGEPWVLGGDVLVSVHGQQVETMEAFVHVMKTLRVGERVAIEFVRLGTRLEGSIVVGERPPGSLKPKHGPNPQAAGMLVPGGLAARQQPASTF